jgi:hypothetical protein
VFNYICNSGVVDSTGIYVLYSEFPPVPGQGALAYHSTGTCNYIPLGYSIPVQFAVVYNLDGYPGVWQPNGDGIHSIASSNLVTSAAHELAEIITDPRINAWYAIDAAGENADKCVNQYPANPEVLQNSTQWRVQMLWSNNAYRNGTGYPGYYQYYGPELGCVSGS